MNSYTVCIPGRLASTRMPQKLIRNDTGKALMQETIDRVRNCRGANVEVTVDGMALASKLGFNGLIHIPSVEARNGTERVALYTAFDPDRFESVTVNCQADEPLINPRDIETLAQFMHDNPERQIATLVAPLHWNDLENPDVVKAAIATAEEIQHDRHEGRVRHWPDLRLWNCRHFARKCVGVRTPLQKTMHHVGVYAFRTTLLQQWAGDYPCSERAEKEGLEQLAWLDAGFEIAAVEIDEAPEISINTEDDYDKFVRIIQEERAE